MSLELRVFLVAIVGVVALWFGISSILPQQWQVETTISVPAPPGRVLPLLRDFGAWRRWSTISTAQRADTKVAVEGEPGQAGHRLTWQTGGNQGELRMVAAGPEGVDYEVWSRLGVGTTPVRIGTGAIRVAPEDGGSRIVWRDQGRAEAFVDRWFAWFGAQQEGVRQMQESGLTRLRVELEEK